MGALDTKERGGYIEKKEDDHIRKKEEKLDEILRMETIKIRSNILNLYESAIVLLNKGIEKGKGEVFSLSNGRAAVYSIKYFLVSKDKAYSYPLQLSYYNCGSPHLKISLGQPGPDYRLVFDVEKTRDGNLNVEEYSVSGYGDWGEALIRKAQKMVNK